MEANSNIIFVQSAGKTQWKHIRSAFWSRAVVSCLRKAHARRPLWEPPDMPTRLCFDVGRTFFWSHFQEPFFLKSDATWTPKITSTIWGHLLKKRNLKWSRKTCKICFKIHALGPLKNELSHKKMQNVTKARSAAKCTTCENVSTVRPNSWNMAPRAKEKNNVRKSIPGEIKTCSKHDSRSVETNEFIFELAPGEAPLVASLPKAMPQHVNTESVPWRASKRSNQAPWQRRLEVPGRKAYDAAGVAVPRRQPEAASRSAAWEYRIPH